MKIEKKFGDIDLDYAPKDRERVYNHMIEKFGDDYTDYILAIGTVSDKATIDEIGRALSRKFPNNKLFSLSSIADIKKEYEADAEKTKLKYPEIFYYFDGVLNTSISQSIHPAGMVVSPISLSDNYGETYRDGKKLLQIDMEGVHEVSLVKYDILGLKTVGIIKDACKYANISYPKSNKINWEDENVWKDMTISPYGIFQFESDFAFTLLKQFMPKNIFDMSLVTAALRPAGTSYRDELIERKVHKNPSTIIDNLLKDNYGFLCIEENQNVSCIDGIKYIKDVSINDTVYTTNGLEKVNKVYDNGFQNVYKINTMYGELECTNNHQILTENGWKELKNIKQGECIAHYVGNKSTSKYDYRLLKIIGWLLGDGIIGNKNVVRLINQNIEVINSFKQNVESLWSNLQVNIIKRESRVNKFPLYVGSVVWKKYCHKEKPINIFLKDVCINNKLACEKFIPEFIYGLDKECLLNILGAYTDTDSCIKNKKRITLNYKTASKKLADGIREIIRLLGYSSSIYKNKESYNICVCGSIELLKELYPYSIKVRSVYDIDELIVTREHKCGKISISNIKNILLKNNISISKVNKKLSINLNKNKYINIETFKKILNYFNIKCPEIFQDDTIHWAPVENKIYIGERHVYDLEINNTHNFITNGIVTHNCYQEDTIKFLKDICGLSGSEADNIRRAIGRKQKDRLDKAMPSILEGYCKKSNQPRNVAEQEAKEFLQIIEDSADYQFGYNHSIAYCMIGYVCAYLRYYYPLEFICSYLNNADTEKDIANGTDLAKTKKIKILPIKFGISRAKYSFDKKTNSIYKGIGSIKFLNEDVSEELFKLSKNKYTNFTDLLIDIKTKTSINSRQLDILIKLDFFSDFGNSKELLNIVEVADVFKFGTAKTIKKDKIEGSYITSFIDKYATDKNIKGNELKNYTILDCRSLIVECEKYIKSLNIEDIDLRNKIINQQEYLGYISANGKEEDRPILFVQDVKTLRRKSDNKQFGYSVFTQSIGSGITSRFTVFNKTIKEHEKINKGDLIKCLDYSVERGYFTLKNFEKIL